MAKDQIPSNAEVVRREGRRWPILLALVLAALLISTAIALGGRWAYREFIKEEPAVPSPTQAEASTEQQTQQLQSSEEEAGTTETQQGGSQTEPLPDTGG